MRSYVWRLSQFSLTLVLLGLPIAIYWAAQLRFGTAYVEDWLPYEAPSRVDYRAYRQRFGSDQYLLISWRDNSLEDPRLAALADRLRDVAAQRGDLQIEAVEDSRRSVDLLAASLRIASDEAARRLSGVTIGANGTALIAVRLGLGAVSKHSTLVGLVQQLADDVGIAADDLVLAGEAFQIHMIDRSSRESMQYYVVPSSFMALLAAWYCLRSVRLTLLVFSFAGFGQLLGMALVAYAVGEMSAVMVVLPTLIFMLTLSAAVHLANYYRDVVQAQAASSTGLLPGVHALGLGWRPCGLAAATTIMGFGSLFISQLTPVWQFGLLAGLGLAISTTVLLLCFPAACRLIAGDTVRDRLRSYGSFGRSTQPPARSPRHTALEAAGLERLLSWILWRPHAISLIGVLLLVVALAGLFRLKTSTEFVDMFGVESRAVSNLSWLQTNVGPLNSLEFQVRFAEASEEQLLARLGVLQELTDVLLDSPHVSHVYSALTFLPDLPQQAGVRGTIRRSILKSKVLANLDALQASQVWAQEGLGETWRLSVRIPKLNSDNFYPIRDELLKRCAPILSSAEANRLPALIVVSGLRSVVETAHKTLLGDLAGSFSAAFMLITPVMMLIARGFLSGLLLMIPNVLPVALVFGCMGWFNIRLDVASILTASVALGIAVDDTLHFLSWYLRARRGGATAVAGVASAMQACGRPMLHTTLICTAAMLPFLLSDFIPTAKFALLMMLILSGAILGDLILLPALLLSPVGKLLRVGNGLGLR